MSNHYGSRNSRNREKTRKNFLTALKYLSIAFVILLGAKLTVKNSGRSSQFTIRDGGRVVQEGVQNQTWIDNIYGWFESGVESLPGLSDELYNTLVSSWEYTTFDTLTLKNDYVRPSFSNQQNTEIHQFVRQTIDEYPVMDIYNRLAKDGLDKKEWFYMDYIKTFDTLAVYEYLYNGIPASVTLAQGLLESDAGRSKLCQATNNHFGIKAKAKKWRSCNPSDYSLSKYAYTVKRFHDDIYCDFFEAYPDEVSMPNGGKVSGAVLSYWTHSKFLHKKRYAWMLDIEEKEPIQRAELWCRGLKKSGYATAKNYAQDLIKIIRIYELWRFDRI